MKPETRKRVKALLTAISDNGLASLVELNHAYQTLVRIVDTGSSIEGWEENEEDTEACAQCFVNPSRWGWMEDRSRQPEWAKFCEEFLGGQIEA